MVLYCVGAEGNLGRVDTYFHQVADLGILYDWELNALVQVPSATPWGGGNPFVTLLAVGTQGNVGLWTQQKLGFDENAVAPLNSWGILSLDFDSSNNLWCVGTNNNLGLFVDGSWQDQESNWSLISIACDDQGKLWGVGTEGNVGLWTGSQWVDQNLGSSFASITFNRRLGTMWAVDFGGSAGRFSPDWIQDRDFEPWSVKSLLVLDGLR